MTVELTKESIDLGIVVRDAEASLAFYRDFLGFADEGEMPMPGGSMHRLRCGTSLVKLVSLDRPPEQHAPPGGIAGATGYRYWTISVSNLEAVAAAAADAGYAVPISPREIRSGIKIAMLEDPDGNWVELLEMS